MALQQMDFDGAGLSRFRVLPVDIVCRVVSVSGFSAIPGSRDC